MGRFLAGTLAILLLVVVALLRGTFSKRTEADFPHAGLNFSISIGTQCSSDAGSAMCTINAGQSFTVDFKVTSIPPDFAYAGYDSTLTYSGVTVNEGSFVQQGASVWPDCGFPASSFAQAGQVTASCASGIGAQPSTFTGVMFHIDFQCPSGTTGPAVVTLLNGTNNTDLVDPYFVAHGELDDERLAITCSSAAAPTLTATPTNTSEPTPTPMPVQGSTATPSPTNSPVGTATATFTVTPTQSATLTSTPTPIELAGDVNCDGLANSIDAALVLQYGADLIVSLPCQQSADVNHDGSINATDAALILQYVAGLVPHL